MNNLYRNSMTGEVRTYAQWQTWAIEFYNGLTQDTWGRPRGIKDGLMPEDYWTRIQKVLKLEAV